MIGGGDTYYAAFSEAGGLKANDEVRIAGVRVGKVDEIALEGDHVKVAFRVKTDSDFGTDTGAAIRVKTLLGAMYLALEPAGAGQLTTGNEIPVEPHQLALRRRRGVLRPRRDATRQIDTDQLATSLTTLADLTRNTPEEFRRRAAGRLGALGEHRRPERADQHPAAPTCSASPAPCDDRDDDIVGLMQDSDSLFQALVARREAMHNLLVSTVQLSTELTALVRQSRADLKPALTHLDDVVDVLNKNEDNIDNSLRLMAPFYRVFTNTLGNGPWFDTYIQNMPPVPTLSGWRRDARSDQSWPSAPLHRRALVVAGLAIVPPRRQPAEDVDRGLPADRLALRGQRRAGARRPGRQGRQVDPDRHPGRGDHALRRRRPGPARRQGGDHLARRSSATATSSSPRSSRGPDPRRRGSADRAADRRTARARPDLLQPRRPDRRPRSATAPTRTVR